MPRIRYIVDLTDEEREHLLGVTQRGKSSARKIKRAQILLKASGGLGDEQIAEAVGTSLATVFRTRKRFVEEGLLALNERRSAWSASQARWETGSIRYSDGV